MREYSANSAMHAVREGTLRVLWQAPAVSDMRAYGSLYEYQLHLTPLVNENARNPTGTESQTI